MKNAIVLITKPWFGSVAPADEAFGAEILDKFLHTLEGAPEKPAAICFATEGVKALVKGSPIELGLKILAEAGVRVVACGTCVEKYGVGDRLALGEIAGMQEIVRLMGEADKVISV